MLVPVLATLLPMRLPANVPGRAVDESPNTWILATHTGNPGGVLGSWLQPGPVTVVVGFGGMN